MAAAVNRHLEGQGGRIGAPDTLIAGTCLDAGLPILTRNARHFGRVPGLEVLGLE
jgi:predicted nucleic acid-binding protein